MKHENAHLRVVNETRKRSSNGKDSLSDLVNIFTERTWFQPFMTLEPDVDSRRFK